MRISRWNVPTMLALATMLGAEGCTGFDPDGSSTEAPTGTGEASSGAATTALGDTTMGDASSGRTTGSGDATMGDASSGRTTGSGDATTGDASSSSAGSDTTASEPTTDDGSDERGTTGESSSSGGSTTTGVSPLVARDDGPYAVASDQALLVDAAQGVLGNDEGMGLAVVAHDPASSEGGLVTVQPDGSFSYQPPAGLPYGTDRFAYTVEDGLGQSAVAEVRIAVQPAGGVLGLGALGPKGTRLDGIGTNAFSGYAASGAGDVDGDGHADVLLGAYGADLTPGGGTGESYLVRGGPSLPAALSLSSADTRLRGIDAVDLAGRAVSGAGDVNGDGHADLLIGAPLAAPGGTPGAGETYLVYGGPGLPAIMSLDAAGVRIEGAGLGESGSAVSGAGDVNGDGYADLLVGAYAASPTVFQAGEAYLVLGGPALPAVVSLANADVRFQGIDDSDRAGYAVSGAGDVNGDGYADVLVGAYWADGVAAFGGPGGGGQAYLMLGGPVLPPVMSLADADVRFDGVLPVQEVGSAVSGAGDVDGDGYDDVLLGDRYVGASSEGAAYLFYGGPALAPVLTTDLADVRFDGIASEDFAGYDVSGAGDVNADGYADLVMGARGADVGGVENVGAAYLVLGGPVLPASMSLADADLQLLGVDVNDWTGHTVSGAGDVDGDGYDDVLVAAPQGDPVAMFGVQNSGETYLVFGDDLTATTSVLGTPGDDDLAAQGGPASDVVVGGRGHDVLACDGGPDVLRGGQGDDTLVVVDDAFFRVDGGLGDDVLALGAGVALGAAALAPPRVVGIERIQLAAAGASSVAISELALVNLSGTSNTLTIEGDADDEVVLVAGGWLAPVLDGGYVVYGSSTTAAVLRVAAGVTVVGP